MNYLRRNKKATGRGARTGTGGKSYANVFYLSRILLFLRENEGYYTMTEISLNCCTRGNYTKSGIKFLIREGFVKKTNRQCKNNHRNSNVTVYAIRNLGVGE